jgi:hypothetical protein
MHWQNQRCSIRMNAIKEFFAYGEKVDGFDNDDDF